MKQKTLGTTEINVSEAGFGVLALGRTHSGLSDEAGAELLLYALERGMNFFDTAQYYEEYPLMRAFLRRALGSGGGSGAASGERPDEQLDEGPGGRPEEQKADACEGRAFSRSDIVICSKSLASDYEGMAEAVDEALDEMGLDYIDLFLMHEVRSGQLAERAGAWQALLDAKAAGKVRAIGISTHHVDVVWEAACAARRFDESAAGRPADSGDAESSGPVSDEAPDDLKRYEAPGLQGCDCVMALLNIEGMGIRRGEAGGPGGALPGYWIEDRAGVRSEMEDALQACHDKGIGVITMKALGGGNLAADYLEAMDYAFTRPFTDCVMLGMSTRTEADDLLDYLDGRLEDDYSPDISGKTLKVNHEDCVGCGSCRSACASDAIFFAEDGLAEIDLNKCIDCGYCAYACPVRAIIRV